MKNNYYYYEKRSPVKRIIFGALVLALGAGGYWYYVNYFKTADVSRTPNYQEGGAVSVTGRGWTMGRITGSASYRYDASTTSISQLERNSVRPEEVLAAPFTVRADAGRADLVDPDGSLTLYLDTGAEVAIQSDTLRVITGRVRIQPLVMYATSFKFENATISSDSAIEVIADPVAHTAIVRPLVGGALNIEIADDAIIGRTAFATTIAQALGQQITVKTDGDYRTVFTNAPFKLTSLAADPFDRWVREAGTAPAVNPEAEKAVRDYVLSLTAERKDAAVTLTWPAYPGTDFTEYQVLTGQQRAPEYGVTPAQRIDDSTKVSAEFSVATDKEVTYYYRVCIVRAGSGILCSSPATVRITIEKPAITAPTISGFITDFGFALSWTPSADATITDYYLVRSATKQQPTYPADGFIAKFGSGVSQYTDSSVTSATGGVSYYRLCAGKGETVGCSNVLTVRDGVLQR